MNRQTIHAELEQAVAEQGAYIPFELLMALGMLSYARYEAWLQGEVEVLEDALSCGRDELTEVLAAASDWASSLGLLPEARAYRGWGERSGRSLRYFRGDDGSLERLIVTHFRRDRRDSSHQLDLFLDSGVTSALNELVDALVSRNPTLARAQLACLLELEPAHRLAAAAELLCDALEENLGRNSSEDVVGDFVRVEQQMLPSARTLLGPRARDFLAPFWRNIGERLEGQRFDTKREKVHCSWIYAQVLDWALVRDSVLSESEWWRHPVLILRLSHSLYRLGDHGGAAMELCRLSWERPAVAEQALNQKGYWDLAVSEAWRQFQEVDAEPELSSCWFPCWLLLVEPGFSLASAPDVGEPKSGPQRAFFILRELLRCEVGMSSANEGALALRRSLKSEHPALLRLYLEKRVPR